MNSHDRIQPMSETPHSQTPWQLSPQGYILPTHKSPYAMLKLKSPWVEGAWDDDPEAAANAVLIVEAVNSYASLKARIEDLEEFAAWVETWVCNPAGAYSTSSLDGLFGMTRDRMAALQAKEHPNE